MLRPPIRLTIAELPRVLRRDDQEATKQFFQEAKRELASRWALSEAAGRR